MKIQIICAFILVLSKSIYAFEAISDSTKIKTAGISFNSFNKQAVFVGFEGSFKKYPSNIIGVGFGVGTAIYYYRKLFKIQKNLIVGLPFRVYKSNTYRYGNGDGRNGKLLYEIGPQIGFQFEIGEKKFLKLRATYTPVDLIRAKDLD